MVNVMVAEQENFMRLRQRGRPTVKASAGPRSRPTTMENADHDEKRPTAQRRGRALLGLGRDRELGDQPTAVGFRGAAPPETASAAGFRFAASDTTRARPRLARAVALRVSMTSTASSTIC